jgi:23S rRNA pseudouridine2605 synthase
LVASAVTVRKISRRETHLVIELTEGRNREVRRLLAALGHEVIALRRVAFGGLELGGLPTGRWRIVPEAELQAAFPAAPPRRR